MNCILAPYSLLGIDFGNRLVGGWHNIAVASSLPLAQNVTTVSFHSCEETAKMSFIETWVQSWVQVDPPLMGDAMRLLATALKTGSHPPERTLVAPSSFPSIKELQNALGPAAQRP
jgi:hypothetical protein